MVPKRRGKFCARGRQRLRFNYGKNLKIDTSNNQKISIWLQVDGKVRINRGFNFLRSEAALPAIEISSK